MKNLVNCPFCKKQMNISSSHIHNCNSKPPWLDKSDTQLVFYNSVYPELCNKQNLEFLYLEKKLSPYQIAEMYDSKHGIVRTLLQKYNIKIRSLKQSAASSQKKQLVKQRCIEKYGCENVGQSEEIKQKIKSTNLQRYGDTCAMRNKEVANKVIQNWKNKDQQQIKQITDKRVKTNLERFGVQSPLQNKEIMEKVKLTNLKRYGVDNPLKNKNICQKMKDTNTERYGSNCPLSNSEIDQKRTITNLIRFGCKNVFSNAKIKQLIKHRNNYQLKIIKSPNGIDIYLQGYQPYTYYKLLQNYSEDQIITDYEKMPEISYINKNGKTCKYFPDFYVPKDNLIIQTKSKWTYEIDIQNTLLKKQKVQQMGYSMDIQIVQTKDYREFIKNNKIEFVYTTFKKPIKTINKKMKKISHTTFRKVIRFS